MASSFTSITPSQLISHVQGTMRRACHDNSPAYTLVVGAGFSYGVVPTTTQMMREEIGPWFYGKAGLDAMPIADKIQLSKKFWADFNQENQVQGTGFKVNLDEEQLPQNATEAYQTVSMGNVVQGINTVDAARDFLRAMVLKARRKMNGAHFFLASLLQSQQSKQIQGERPFCRTIFTTNFDPLLQTSLQLVQQLYYMTDRPELGIHADHLQEDNDAIHLIYTHGSIHRPYLQNTDEELRRLTTNVPSFRSYMERRGIIVIGYSGWDDSIMKALSECTGFANNLYWCGMHSPDVAENSLSPNVKALLSADRGHRFYVPLQAGGADLLMGMLFQSLAHGEGIPHLLRDPFKALAERLENTDLSSVELKRFNRPPSGESVREASATTTTPELKISADSLRKDMIDVLHSAQQQLIGDGNESEYAISPRENQEKPKRTKKRRPKIDARLMSEALNAYFGGDAVKAIDLWGKVIELPGASPEQVAEALFNLGITYGEQGKPELAIGDYTRVIELPGAPSEQVAKALFNRGFTYGQQGKPELAIGDYARVIELPGAPPEQVAEALLNRGITYGEQGKPELEIGDYTRAIELPGAPPEQVAKALFNRGITYGQQGKPELEIGDYARVIELPGAPPEQVAGALVNRGFTYGQQGKPELAIGDYTRAIELPGAPPEPVAGALVNRGFKYGEQGKPELAVGDYTRAIELPGAPPEQVAKALFNRGFKYGQQGKPELAIGDYTRVIELPGAPPEQVAGALVNRGFTYGQQGKPELAIGDYTRVIELPGAPSEQVAKALFNRGIKYGEQGKPELAIGDYTRVIELPGAPSEQVAKALFNRGFKYGEQGKPELAIGDYTRAIELPGAPPEQVTKALLNRGITYGEQGKPELEIGDYTRAIELPGAPPEQVAKALLNRGWAFYRDGEGDAEKFLDDTKRSFDLVATSLVTRFNYALALLFANRDAEALEIYSGIVADNPSVDKVREALQDVQDARIKWLSEQRVKPIMQILSA